MLSYLASLTIFQRIEFFLYKPLLVVAFLAIPYVEFVQGGSGLMLAWFITGSSIVLMLVYLAEFKLASVIRTYRSPLKKDMALVLKQSRRYLALRFSDVSAGDGFVVGRYTYRFTLWFHLWAEDDQILVRLDSSFPFPASLSNWLRCAAWIEEELGSHAFYRQ